MSLFGSARNILFDFFADLSDRSAKSRPNNKWVSDIWATSLMAFSSAASYADTLTKFAQGLVGNFGGFLPILIAILGIGWCVHVIHSKSLRQHIRSPAQSEPSLQYNYGQSVRHLAKAGLILLLIIVPLKVSAVFDEVIPLPSTIYGSLVDAKTGKPIADARVRIVNADGVDITKGSWLSDSEGFYIIETVQLIHRDSHLLVAVLGCDMEQSLSLRRVDESQLDALGRVFPAEVKPTFRHVISCGGK